MYGKSACPVLRGAGGQPAYGRDTVAPPRKQAATEKTNIVLQRWETPAYSKATWQWLPVTGDPAVAGRPP